MVIDEWRAKPSCGGRLKDGSNVELEEEHPLRAIEKSAQPSENKAVDDVSSRERVRKRKKAKELDDAGRLRVES